MKRRHIALGLFFLLSTANVVLFQNFSDYKPASVSLFSPFYRLEPQNNLNGIICGHLNNYSTPDLVTPCPRTNSLNAFIWRVDKNIENTYRDLSTFTGVFNNRLKDSQKGIIDSASVRSSVQAFSISDTPHYSFYLDTRDRTPEPEVILLNGNNPRTHLTAGLSYSLVSPLAKENVKTWVKPWNYLRRLGTGWNLEWKVSVLVNSSSGRYQDPVSMYANSVPYVGSNIIFAYRTGIDKDAHGKPTGCPITLSLHYGPQIYDPRYNDSLSVEEQTIVKPSISLDAISEKNKPGSASVNVIDVPHRNSSKVPVENKYSYSMPGSTGMRGTVSVTEPIKLKIRLTREKFTELLRNTADKTDLFLNQSCKDYLKSQNRTFRFSENADDYYIDYFAVSGEISTSTLISKECSVIDRRTQRGCGHLGFDISEMTLRACPESGCKDQ